MAALTDVLGTGTGPWLAPGHTAIAGIDENHKPGGAAQINAVNLAEYFAVAAPNHCLDGWTYLSRALNAYLLGDSHSAWHFGYYAELRAAQSILSASGCGAFNSWNAVLTGAGAIQQVDTPHTRAKGTHTMVWLALPQVLEFSPGGLASLNHVAEIYGVPLTTLVGHAFPGPNAAQLATRWISDWSFDISAGLEDKQFRNRCVSGWRSHLASDR